MSGPQLKKFDLYDVRGSLDEGVTSSIRMTKSAIAQPNIVYKDTLLTGEIYMEGEGESTRLWLNLYCPRCLNSLRIHQDRKKLEWAQGHGLFVEPFKCTWELGDRQGERMQFGLGLCGWAVGIDPCWKIVDTNEGPMIISGIARET